MSVNYIMSNSYNHRRPTTKKRIDGEKKKKTTPFATTHLLVVLLLCLFPSSPTAHLHGPSVVNAMSSWWDLSPREWKSMRRKIIATGCVVGIGTLCARCLQVITTGDECLIERFGKYHRKLEAGWHLILPIVEKVSFHVTTREQVLDVPPQQCYTKDNAPLKADAVVYMRIHDVLAAKYNVEDVQLAILNLCLTQLREEVGKLTLDESFSSRERINKELLKDLNEVCIGWGVQITRVEIQNLQPSPTIKDAMELQMAAERKKRATILHSEGERQTLMNEADGKAHALIVEAEAQNRVTTLQAEAEATRQRLEAQGLQVAINSIADAILMGGCNTDSSTNNHDSSSSTGTATTTQPPPMTREKAVYTAIQFLSTLRYLETQTKFATSNNNSKIIMLPSLAGPGSVGGSCSGSVPPFTYGGLKFLMEHDD